MRTTLTMAAMAVLLAAPALAQDQPTYGMKEPGVKAPVLVREVKPNYTSDAMRRQVQGVVEMKAVVKTDGSVDDIRVTRSLDPDLDEEAMKALRRWEFKPGTKDGQAVNVEVDIEMTFTLRKKGGL